MKFLYALLLAVLAHAAGAQPVSGQTASFQIPDTFTRSAKDIAGYLATHYKGQSAQTRAAFIWLAMNTEYDVANMYALNFYEQRDDKVRKLLQTRKGICEGYAATFCSILSELGMDCNVVEGYTRQNGVADYIPHAWCAARVDSIWLLYDPTWGSGFISNGKFVRRLNYAYYAAKGNSFIKSHMPFDYLWQMLNYPVSNQEFYESRFTEDKTKPFFAYYDSIAVYNKLSQKEQLLAQARRVEANGLRNAMIFDRLHHLKEQLEYDQQSQSVNNYNGAVADYNEGVRLLNDFINYRNVQFKPIKPDNQIQAMLDGVAGKFDAAIGKLNSISNARPEHATLINQLRKTIADASKQEEEMQDWLTKYFSKSKAARKTMFYKITWFGVPLN